MPKSWLVRDCFYHLVQGINIAIRLVETVSFAGVCRNAPDILLGTGRKFNLRRRRDSPAFSGCSSMRGSGAVCFRFQYPEVRP